MPAVVQYSKIPLAVIFLFSTINLFSYFLIFSSLLKGAYYFFSPIFSSLFNGTYYFFLLFCSSLQWYLLFFSYFFLPYLTELIFFAYFFFPFLTELIFFAYFFLPYLMVLIILSKCLVLFLLFSEVGTQDAKKCYLFNDYTVLLRLTVHNEHTLGNYNIANCLSETKRFKIV